MTETNDTPPITPDPFDKLRDRLNREREDWKGVGSEAVAGDELYGVVVERDKRETKHGVSDVVVVQIDDGRELAVPAFGTVLSRDIPALDPQPGELFGIKYLGTQGANEYKAYRVEVVDKNGDFKSKAGGSAASAGLAQPGELDDGLLPGAPEDVYAPGEEPW